MRAAGFTLVEMVIVIAVTAVIAAAVAVFIRLPVQGYVDTARRAELTDIADTALRRIGRDIRLALPNSVRVTDSNATIEFLPTKTGGRYRVGVDNAGNGDKLDFAVADSAFDQIGLPTLPADQTITPNADSVVIYNLGNGISGADAYQSGANNRSLITNVQTGGAVLPQEQRLTISAKQFPLESPSNRFQVISAPVSYVCAGGTLRRYWGYAIQAGQPTAASLPGLAGVQSALLADRVASCVFTYDQGVTERSGLVTLLLALTSGGETVRLYHEVHVNNVP